MLKPIQDAYRDCQDYIEQDGLEPINATILRLAVDGLWFSEIFGLAPLEDDRRELVLERLIQFSKMVDDFKLSKNSRRYPYEQMYK